MADGMELAIRREGGIGLVEIQGYINNTGGEQIAAACDRLMGEGTTRLVLDLAGCRIVNSVGISILLELIEKLQAVGGSLAFSCATPTIAKSFRIMGLLQTCALHATQAEAIEAMRP
jgi:anti-anti-sigma factor